MATNATIGDCALNCGAIQSLSDARVFAPGSMSVEGESELDVRQSAAAPGVPAGSPQAADDEPAAAELTDAQRATAETLARHWLVELGSGAELLPPDPRDLSASPSLEEIWHSLATRNDLTDIQLASHVAAAYKLPVARLDQLSHAALAAIPERLARRLGVIPVSSDAKNLVVAISDPCSVEIEQQLHFVTSKRLQFQIAPPSEIRGALDRYSRASAPR